MYVSQNNNRSFYIYLFAYFALTLIGALGGLICLLLIPSDPKNKLLFGYSASRLVLIVFFLVAIVSAVTFGLKSWRNVRWVKMIDVLFFTNPNTTNISLGCSGALFLICGFLTLIPLFRFGQFAAYAERLRPIALFAVQISFQTLILILLRTGRLNWELLAQEMRTHRLTLWTAAICMAIFVCLWVVISFTGIGIHPTPSTNWYETGVPILAIQVAFAALIAFAISGLIIWLSGKKENRGADILLSISIWALTAFLWTQAPMAPNFFAPGPYAPDYAYLPYSDAASFDMSAQYALAGNGIANGNVFKGHNAYHGFLAFLHLLAGQDNSLLVMLQVIIFAVLPVIVYFIGNGMQGRFCGLFLAGLTIFQELNAIASGSRLNLSHSKLLLTEFPSKIGLALLILLLFLWLRKPGDNFAYAFPLGGVLGILIMLRYNMLLMPFCVIAGFALVFGKGWRNWLKASVIMIFALGITLSPWMWRSWKISGSPFFFAPKLVHRLKLEFESPLEPPLPDDNLPDTEFDGGLGAQGQKSESDDSNFVNFSPSQTMESGVALPFEQGLPAEMATNEDGKVYLIGSNFVHNLITNFLILPTRLPFDFLPDSIVDGSIYESVPFWKNLYTGWLKALPPVDLVGIGINLLLLSIGIGASYRKWQLAGLIPLGVFLAYHLSTAVVRDSGGRYIVPVDWIVLLYFTFGLLQIMLWNLAWLGVSVTPSQSVKSVSLKLSIRAALLMTLPFFIYTLCMTVLDQSMPQRYTHLSKAEVLVRLDQSRALDETPFAAAHLTRFLNHPESRAVYGRNLYPRFFWRNRGLHQGIYLDQPYPRLAFTMLSASGPEYALLPLTEPPATFPHGADVIVIGCRRGLWYIDALLVAIFGNPDQPTIYTRNPASPSPLTCPLGE